MSRPEMASHAPLPGKYERTLTDEQVQALWDAREKSFDDIAVRIKDMGMEAALASTVTTVEESVDDPELAEIDARVFGPAGKLVAQVFDVYREWSNRVYISDVFGDDHVARTTWRQAYRRAFGPSGQQYLREFEAKDKYRTAPTIGLTTQLGAIAEMLEDSGEDVDEALGHAIAAQWNNELHVAFYENYGGSSDEQKKHINAEFGKRFSSALQLLVDEAARRVHKAA